MARLHQALDALGDAWASLPEEKRRGAEALLTHACKLISESLQYLGPDLLTAMQPLVAGVVMQAVSESMPVIGHGWEWVAAQIEDRFPTLAETLKALAARGG